MPGGAGGGPVVGVGCCLRHIRVAVVFRDRFRQLADQGGDVRKMDEKTFFWSFFICLLFLAMFVFPVLAIVALSPWWSLGGAVGAGALITGAVWPAQVRYLKAPELRATAIHAEREQSPDPGDFVIASSRLGHAVADFSTAAPRHPRPSATQR